MNPSASMITYTYAPESVVLCNPQPPAPAETFCNSENIVISVPPEKMNLKFRLPFRLCDHMTEQQDKNNVSNEVYGLSIPKYNITLATKNQERSRTSGRGNDISGSFWKNDI